MNVLHIFPKNNELIQKHVQLLVEGLRQSANVKVAENSRSFLQQARDMEADILHIHGLDQMVQLKALRCCVKNNIRFVMTLHGQLQPFEMSALSKQEHFRRLIVANEYLPHAYAVITLGKMETKSFSHLGHNPRIEEIHNAIITNTITPAEMAAQTFAVYQKVMDSNTLEQMDPNTIQALKAIIKVGIMGDKRWVDENSFDPRLISWRHLLLYADHENISNYTDYGIRLLGLSAPLIDIGKVAAYFPKKYTRPQPVKEIVGDYQGNQTDFLMRIIRQVLKAPNLLNALELTRELYRDNVNDDELAEKLEEENLSESAGRLMQVLSDMLLLDEGYMPVDPINDKHTLKLSNNLKNHLKI